MTQARPGVSVHSAKLADYLATRRWFGGKGRAIARAALADLIPVKWPSSPAEFAVGRAEVTTDEGGGSACYQLFLDDASELDDALENPAFTRGLAGAFQTGARFEGDGGSRWVVASEGKTPFVAPPHVPVTLSRSEQTNSSLFIGTSAILKLYRRLETGVHPDVEVTRFLTIDRGFPHVPVLLGTIRFEDGGDVTTAGMLQEVVPGAIDGFTYARDCAARQFAPREEGAPEIAFEADAAQLGVVTRALHETLASGDRGTDFELRLATADDVRRWADGARRTIEASLASLARAMDRDLVPADHRAAATALLLRQSRYGSWLEEIASGIAADAGANTRTHGDYHLGQVLRSAAGEYLVIDFEGEPSRPLRERRARQSPLRDVAGMLRSFAYAAAAGGGQASSEWESAMRTAFLRGYFADTRGNAALLPRSRSNTDRLMALFEAEKVFYELRYELDHRPDWMWIPLRGIATLDA